jgi:glutamyl/glutaminyl-tRNA synthetase
MNGWHIRQLSLDALYELTQATEISREAPISFWPESAATYDDSHKKRVLGLVQERLKYLAELPELTDFFFRDLPINPELISSNKQLKKFDQNELKTMLQAATDSINQSDFSITDLTDRLNALLETTGQKPGILFSLIRIATTQAPFSPPLAETLAVLGPEVTRRRLEAQLKQL